MKKIVLGIETSCDDTSLALLEGEPYHPGDVPGASRPVLLSHRTFTQEMLLRKWGGVVPEIAARNHVEKIVPLMEEAFSEAKLRVQDVDLIGVTTHPGLLGPLLTGVNAAKTLSLVHRIPVLGVNHLYAHLEAIHLTDNVSYPYLGVLVSGGNTLFLLVHSRDHFEKLGGTVDDAAGEAFDKGGKLMGLPYPAGRIIDLLAKKGDPHRFSFPIGMKNSGDANLSFSGVKTSLRVFLDKHQEYQKLAAEFTRESNDSLDKECPKPLADLCASYQEAIIEALVFKLKWAMKQVETSALPLVVGGGVACNGRLRERFASEFGTSMALHFVPPRFCTDNGAMIANYTLRNADKAIPYPDSLTMDASGKCALA